MTGDKTTCPICAMVDWADEDRLLALWAAYSLGSINRPARVKAAMCESHLESASEVLNRAADKIDQFEKTYGKPAN